MPRTPPRADPSPADLSELAVHADQAAALLKALAHPARLMVLCALAQGERSVGALNAGVPLTQSALSQHLARLRAQGLVLTRRDRQQIHYRLAPGPASKVVALLHAEFCAPGAPVRD